MKTTLCAVLLTLCPGIAGSVFAADYSGNNVLLVLGVSVNAPQFGEFKSNWLLNRDYAGPDAGVKLYVNKATNKVESILLAGEGLVLNNEKFSHYSAALPFGLSLNDDAAALTRKLGDGEKLADRSTYKFLQKSLAVEVSYTGSVAGKIRSIKIYRNGNQANAMATASIDGKPAINSTRNNGHGLSTTYAASGASPFKTAILQVFKAARESFVSVKSEARGKPNFWNYKYTYNTSLSVPGQLYNMLYNFPFLESQSDFVVVIKEADRYNASFDSAYHRIERELIKNFKPAEGWTEDCIAGSNKEKLPNLKFHNEQIGSIILDCSQNPKGRQVLYIRFLFYSG